MQILQKKNISNTAAAKNVDWLTQDLKQQSYRIVYWKDNDKSPCSKERKISIERKGYIVVISYYRLSWDDGYIRSLF